MNRIKLSKEAIIKLTICAVAILISITALVLYFAVIKPKTNEGEKNVTLIIQYQNKEYKYENLFTDKLYVLDFLIEYDELLELKLQYDNDPLYGAFVTSLKSTDTNIGAGLFYKYTINDDYALGVSTQPISDGDVIKFVYTYELWEEVEDGFELTESAIAAGGDNSNTGLSDQYDNVLWGIVFLTCGAVVFSGAFIGITILKEKQANNKHE